MVIVRLGGGVFCQGNIDPQLTLSNLTFIKDDINHNDSYSVHLDTSSTKFNIDMTSYNFKEYSIIINAKVTYIGNVAGVLLTATNITGAYSSVLIRNNGYYDLYTTDDSSNYISSGDTPNSFIMNIYNYHRISFKDNRFTHYTNNQQTYTNTGNITPGLSYISIANDWNLIADIGEIFFINTATPDVLYLCENIFPFRTLYTSDNVYGL